MYKRNDAIEFRRDPHHGWEIGVYDCVDPETAKRMPAHRWHFVIDLLDHGDRHRVPCGRLRPKPKP